MQGDFHYYATYCAAYLAGYTHEESMDICYGAQLVDLCSKTFLSGIGAPEAAATTMLQLEMMDARTDIIGLQDITRIWSSFHFLPRDLYSKKAFRTKSYMSKYRLICGPDGDLVKDTVELAKGRALPCVGIAMHVVADTWAHEYFAGTPSLVINNTSGDFNELVKDEAGIVTEKKIAFRHNPSAQDDLDKNIYTNSLSQRSENAVMNLGHGRAGHLPDYSFITYRYTPAWDDYREMVKDNPSDYRKAFAQLVYAMKYIRGDVGEFTTRTYDFDAIAPHEDRIKHILTKRQLIASDDWKAFGQELSGRDIPGFDIAKYQEEYKLSPPHSKNDTYLGRFIDGAIAQKEMVSRAIWTSGNFLAGFFR